jgi:hypothetical protein
MRTTAALVMVTGLTGVACEYGCNIGDNRAIHEFHKRLHPGSHVLAAITEAEKAQGAGVAFEVWSLCSSDCQRGSADQQRVQDQAGRFAMEPRR